MEEAEGWSLGKWCSVLLARSSASMWLKDFIFVPVSALKVFVHQVAGIPYRGQLNILFSWNFPGRGKRCLTFTPFILKFSSPCFCVPISMSCKLIGMLILTFS